MRVGSELGPVRSWDESVAMLDVANTTEEQRTISLNKEMDESPSHSPDNFTNCQPSPTAYDSGLDTTSPFSTLEDNTNNDWFVVANNVDHVTKCCSSSQPPRELQLNRTHTCPTHLDSLHVASNVHRKSSHELLNNNSVCLSSVMDGPGISGHLGQSHLRDVHQLHSSADAEAINGQGIFGHRNVNYIDNERNGSRQECDPKDVCHSNLVNLESLLPDEDEALLDLIDSLASDRCSESLPSNLTSLALNPLHQPQRMQHVDSTPHSSMSSPALRRSSRPPLIDQTSSFMSSSMRRASDESGCPKANRLLAPSFKSLSPTLTMLQPTYAQPIDLASMMVLSPFSSSLLSIDPGMASRSVSTRSVLLPFMSSATLSSGVSLLPKKRGRPKGSKNKKKRNTAECASQTDDSLLDNHDVQPASVAQLETLNTSTSSDPRTTTSTSRPRTTRTTSTTTRATSTSSTMKRKRGRPRKHPPKTQATPCTLSFKLARKGVEVITIDDSDQDEQDKIASVVKSEMSSESTLSSRRLVTKASLKMFVSESNKESLTSRV